MRRRSSLGVGLRERLRWCEHPDLQVREIGGTRISASLEESQYGGFSTALRFGRNDSIWIDEGERRTLLAELYYGRALAAFIVGGFRDGCYVGVFGEELAEGAAEDAHAYAVDDADAGQAGEKGAFDEAVNFALGFVGGAADDVDLRGHVVGVV